jgi:TPP-dependent pyruvate/acetoin dehydrogenase alpha subunit
MHPSKSFDRQQQRARHGEALTIAPPILTRFRLPYNSKTRASFGEPGGSIQAASAILPPISGQGFYAETWDRNRTAAFPAPFTIQATGEVPHSMTAKTRERTALTQPPPFQNGFSLISNGRLLQLYVTMLRCRLIHERICILLKQNELAEANLTIQNASWGQEAAVVGVTIGLLAEDSIFPRPGDFIPFFIRNLQLEELFRALVDSADSSSTTAAQLKLALDAAMVKKVSGNKNISVAISGQSKSSSSWQRALAHAGRHELPVIFVSWNHIPPKTKIHSVPVITVDGNDVVAVYRVATEAMAQARMGNGPTLIECVTETQNPGDPIQTMGSYLTRKGLFSETLKAKEASKFSRELEVAIEAIHR